MAGAVPFPEYTRRRRSRRRWVVRLLAGLIVLLAIAYASLPLWLPTDWLSRRLANQLSAELNRAVNIDRVHLGWIEGVVFEGITIQDRPGAAAEPLASIQRIRCDLDPITTLITGRVASIEIDEPTLSLTADENGRLNVSDLAQRQGGRLPARSFLVRGLLCHVHTPHAEEVIRFDRLECTLNPATGTLRFLGEVRPRRDFRAARPSTDRQLSIDAEITVPRLNPAVSLGGGFKIAWTGLALADLPLSLIPSVPFEQVEGTSTGRLHVETLPDLHLEFDTDLQLDGVRIRWPDSARQSRIPDAQVRARGHWDTAADVFLLTEFDYRTPAIQLTGRPPQPEQPALRLDLVGAPPMAAHFAGVVNDWRLLHEEVPALGDLLLKAGLTAQGSARFSVDLDHQQQQDHLILSVDVSGSACDLVRNGRRWLHLDKQPSNRLDAELTLSRGDHLRIQPRLSLQLADLALKGKGDVTVPTPIPQEPADLMRACMDQIIPSLQTDWAFTCKDFRQALAICPALAEAGDFADWHGPIEAVFTCQPTGEVNRLHFRLAKGQDAAMRFRDLFDTPAGEPLTVEFGCDLPRGSANHLGGLLLTLSHGPAGIQLDAQNAGLDYAFDFTDSGSDRDRPPFAIRAAGRLPVHVRGIERIGPLCPRWPDFFPPGSTRGLTGDADLLLTGEFATRPGEQLLRCMVDLTADDLAIRWDDLLDKSAGMPLGAEIALRRERLDDDLDTAWSAVVRRPGGRVSATLRRGERAGDVSPLEHLRAQADIGDVAEWLAVSPLLRRHTSSWRPAGAFTVQFDSLLAAGAHDLSLLVDATRAAFELPADPPATKPLGVEARLAARLHGTPSGGSENMLWNVVQTSISLAGADLPQVTGSFVTSGPLPQPRSTGLPILLESPTRPSVRDIHIEGSGGVHFDEPLRSLHPRLRRWCDAYNLTGRAILRAALQGSPDHYTLTGRLDGQDLAFAIPTGTDLAPTISKPAGMPGLATFNLTALPASAGTGPTLRLNEAVLDLAGNDLTLTGDLVLAESRQSAGLERFDLVADLCLNDLPALDRLLADGQVRHLDGRCNFSLSIQGTPGAWSVREGRLAFHECNALLAGDNVGLDGRIDFRDQQLSLDRLRCVFGASEGLFDGRLRLAADSALGRLALIFDRLDLPDLTLRLERWSDRTPAAADRPTAPAARRILDQLHRCELEIETSVDLCRAVLPGNQTLQADLAHARTLIQKGPVATNFRALVDGGLVTGEFTSHTQVAEPTYHLTYTADSILPGPLVDGYLRQMFPGMTATGPLTLIDETYQKLLPAPGDPNYEIGEGELIINGGSIQGRAAPLWMTRIFPGLNFARFDFSYMHSWFKKLPDGLVRHQMIYQGQYYNVYMIGHSDPTKRFRYEVGIDFLANFDSQYWAESGQGRIPLFIKTGRIDERGQLLDEEVTFVSPDRVLSTLFVQNNPVVTAYYAVRQRALGGE